MPAAVKLTRHLTGAQIRRGKFDVLVDGTGVASIDAHEIIETPVEPGHHTLQLRYGRYSSRTAAFDTAEGQAAAFRCGEKSYSSSEMRNPRTTSRALSVSGVADSRCCGRGHGVRVRFVGVLDRGWLWA